MKPIHIGTSPLTNRIFAGTVLKDGQTWAAGKQDVTGNACAAVCQYVIGSSDASSIEVTCNGEPKWEIIVRELK
jgi:hypothetical protein